MKRFVFWISFLSVVVNMVFIVAGLFKGLPLFGHPLMSDWISDLATFSCLALLAQEDSK